LTCSGRQVPQGIFFLLLIIVCSNPKPTRMFIQPSAWFSLTARLQKILEKLSHHCFCLCKAKQSANYLVNSVYNNKMLKLPFLHVFSQFLWWEGVIWNIRNMYCFSLICGHPDTDRQQILTF